MLKILILSSSYLEKDPRILRQIKALKDDYSLYTCGLSKSNIVGLEAEFPILFRPSKKQSIAKRANNYFRMKLGHYENLTWNRQVLSLLDRVSFDIIIVNDPREMSLALALKNGKSSNAKIYFDLHEWYDEVDENEFVNKMFRSLTDKYFAKANATSTVNEEIADLYKKKYSVRPQVVSNAGKYFDLQPQKLDRKSIKMVHHGVLNASRKLEEMIFLMDLLDDRFTLDFYLVGANRSYKEQLVKLSNPKKVRFMPPVSFDQIVPTLHQYDVGLFILQEDVASYKYALPNKLFEFVQARLAVAISPNISMKKIVEKYNIGVIGTDFTAKSLAKKLNALSLNDIQDLKSKSHYAASILNEDEGIKTIKQIVTSLELNLN